MDNVNNIFAEYLKPSRLCNFNEVSEIIDVAQRLVATYSDAKQQADCIYKFIKELPFKYDDWHIKASDTLSRGWGMCSGKANLFVAMLRSIGIPSRYVVIRCRGELELWDWMTRQSNELERICGDIPKIGHHVVAEVYLGNWKVYDVARDPSLEQGLVRLNIPIEFRPMQMSMVSP
jgi:transglutaminase-like putative cysteine protease